MAEEAKDENKTSEDVLPNPGENPRNKMFNAIAEEENQHKKDGVEFADVADEDHNKSVPVEDEPRGEPTEVVKADQRPQKFKIKANGIEEELTPEELIKRAELASGAEAKFQEAARMRREAEEIAARAAQPAQAAVPQPSVEDDDRALARALQMGSEEEAAGVIKRIRSQALVQPGQIAGMVEMVTSGNWFRQEYPEIFADPWLTKIALDEDERLVKSGDRRSYKDRYKAIGDKLREWKGTQAAVTEKKLEKKASLSVVPKADVRASNAAGDDDNKTDEQVNREFIAAEAKRRGQQYVR